MLSESANKSPVGQIWPIPKLFDVSLEYSSVKLILIIYLKKYMQTAKISKDDYLYLVIKSNVTIVLAQIYFICNNTYRYLKRTDMYYMQIT